MKLRTGRPGSIYMALAVILTVSALAGAVHAQSAEFHSDFDAILRANVSDGFINYPGIAADSRFPAYIDRISAPLPAGQTPAENLTFWINAYNALSIKGILDGHSPKSLLGRYKYFKRIKYTVGGKVINLYDLERDVIIPLGEPRIHFAIVCASHSCPALRSEAYVASRLEQQLDEQARGFLNDESKNSFDEKSKTANLSKIFDWFAKDFENHAGSVQEYVADYVRDDDIARALRADEYRVKHKKYSWTLNGNPPS